MALVIDHVFICCAKGAPEARHLIDFGLLEGPPNRHPGQGTACRRFYFRNAMLELIWLEDAAEAQSPPTRRTRLFERFGPAASPFGIIVRADGACDSPFEAWEYRPSSMPDLALRIAANTGLDEPMWCYLEMARAAVEPELLGVRIICPPLAETSVTRAMARQNVIGLAEGPAHLLELDFAGKRGHADFRPHLPLIIR